MIAMTPMPKRLLVGLECDDDAVACGMRGDATASGDTGSRPEATPSSLPPFHTYAVVDGLLLFDLLLVALAFDVVCRLDVEW